MHLHKKKFVEKSIFINVDSFLKQYIKKIGQPNASNNVASG